MRLRLISLIMVLVAGLFWGMAVAEGADAVVSARYMDEGEASGALADIVLDAEGPRILIEFWEDVYGFELVFGEEIDMDSFAFTQIDSLYRAGVARAGESVCVRAYLPDTIPNLKISYVTQHGGIEEYLISESGEDGSVILIDAPRGEVSASEAEGLLIARFGEADAETGNTFSWGLADDIVYEGAPHYLFRVSWLVIDEGGGGHMSYLCDMLVSKADGAILVSDDAGGWTRVQFMASSGDDWAIDKAHTVAMRMARLASEEAYLKLFVSDGDVLNAASSAGELSGKPLTRALVIDMPTGDKFSTLMTTLGGAQIALSDEAMAELNRRVPNMIANMLNSKFGSVQLAAASVVATSDAFSAPDNFVNCMVVLDYGAAACAIVALTRAGDNIVSANASVLPAEALPALDDMKAPIGAFGDTREYAY